MKQLNFTFEVISQQITIINGTLSSKCIKQHHKIKLLGGTTQSAVHILIFTTITACYMVAIVKMTFNCIEELMKC